MEIEEIDEVLSNLLAAKDRKAKPETAAQSWPALCQRIRTKRRRRRICWTGSGVLIACTCLLIPWNHRDDSNSITRYAESQPQALELEGDIKLSIKGRPDMVISASDANIIHSGNGVVTINSDAQGKVVVSESTVSEKPTLSAAEFNQLVVPAGKRTNLTLSDGTRIWINSGSRLVYPETFDKHIREVFLEGEAYFEVTSNEACPFHVRTDNCDVTARGTIFDVSACSNRNEAFVVLVNGNVDVNNHEGDVSSMKPGQIVTLKGAVMSAPMYTDISPYVSWVKDYLIFKNEKLGVALEKIGRQYGRTFLLAPGISEISVSGKLYLKEDLSSVLRTISYSLPVSFEDHNESIYVHESAGDF